MTNCLTQEIIYDRRPPNARRWTNYHFHFPAVRSLSSTIGQNNRQMASIDSKFSAQFVKLTTGAAPGDTCDDARRTNRKSEPPSPPFGKDIASVFPPAGRPKVRALE
jgi:hypothetical protein